MAFNSLLKTHLISATSMGATITSAAFPCQFQDNIGIQLDWTGSPVGAFSIQTSIDHAQDSQGVITTAGHWITLTLSTAITASGSADDAYIDLNQLSAPWIRVVYTSTSGTGTLDCFIAAKGV